MFEVCGGFTEVGEVDPGDGGFVGEVDPGVGGFVGEVQGGGSVKGEV